MNTKEIKNKIQAMERELEELKEELKQKESLTPPKRRWRAKENGGYYFTNAGGMVCREHEHSTNSDNMRYAIGNYYKTSEEAEFEAERLKVISELKEWATPAKGFDWDDCYDIKYMIILESDEVKVDYFTTYQSSDLYFKTREQAESAIEAVGEDRIIKYYFRRQKCK